MIRVYVTRDERVDGGWSMQVYGHARTDVCAATTALINGLVSTFAWLAKRYPRELRLTVKDATRR